MIDRVLGAIALIVLAAFLGILIMKVTRIDLISVVGITFLLALWDYIRTAPKPITRR